MKNLDKNIILSHMNKEHMDSIINIIHKFTTEKNISKALMIDIDSTGMYFSIDDKKNIKVPFPKEVSVEEIPKTIIEMSKNAGKVEDKSKEILDELEEYISSFNSLTLGTLSPENRVTLTYAPFVKKDNDFYILISEVADHYINLKTNPDNFEIMFLEDENKAISPLVRKRARFYSKCEFIEKNEEILDLFENKLGPHVKSVRNMEDFHLVKLTLLNGRFVKGFGQAYLIENNKIIHMTGTNKGHKWNLKGI
ncbi:MAG: HugZ family heme oxygenase [Cetobacterium sp.]|nr:HugZ family heme oxygenase [Cetobacterium sp.]